MVKYTIKWNFWNGKKDIQKQKDFISNNINQLYNFKSELEKDGNVFDIRID